MNGIRRAATYTALALFAMVLSVAPAQKSQYAGTNLNFIVVSDQFSAALEALAPVFQEQTGINLRVTVLGYGELYQRAIADFIGHTAQADLYSTDIVWSCQFAENGYLTDLASLIKRDEAELDLDDIPTVMWTTGSCGEQQIAFPLVGYAGVLAYNKAAFDAAGIAVPKTMTELAAAAQALTKDGKAGIVMNGQRGTPAAQDWMFYMLMNGGSILGPDGKPALNSPINVETLELYADLFKYAPDGAVSYAWGERVTSFSEGSSMMMVDWSAGLDYLREGAVPVSGSAAITTTPVREGLDPVYPFGGWGVGINADSPSQGAAWEFIKWLSSPEVQKQYVELGGKPIRHSTLTDPDLVAKYPFLSTILEVVEHGDGDFRPRITQYSQIEDAVGLAVNLVITGQESAQAALDAAQATVAPLFR